MDRAGVSPCQHQVYNAPTMAEARPRGGVSPGIWVPIVWYAFETSSSVSRWLSVLGYSVAPATDYVEGSPLDRAVYSCLLALGLMILMSRRIQWGEILRKNAWLTGLFLYMLASLLWSDYPDVSFKRWIRALVDLVMVLVVLTDVDPLLAECTVLRRAMYITLPLSIIFIKYFRGFGTAWDEFGNEMWTGVTNHKNVLGEVAMMGALYFVFELVRRTKGLKRWIYALYLFMALWILRGSPSSRSTTSISGFVLGVLILMTLYSVRSRIAHIRRYLVGCSFAAGFVFLIFQLYQAATDTSVVATGIEAAGRDATLTGRTDLWVALMNIASSHPILGVGYGAFWIGNTHNLWDTFFWRPGQGHNGYLDVYVELGIVGLIFLAGVLISAYRGILDLLTRHFEQGALHFTWLTIIVIHNITESSYLKGTVDLWFLFLLSAVMVPRRAEGPVPAQSALPGPQPVSLPRAGRLVPPSVGHAGAKPRTRSHFSHTLLQTRV